MIDARDRDALLREVERVIVGTELRATRLRAILELRRAIGRDTAVADEALHAAEERLERLDVMRRRLSRAVWPARP